MARTNTNAARNNRMETLEERQMFSTYGTINIACTGQNPTTLVDYTRNDVHETMGAGGFLWARSATDPGTYAGGWKGTSTIETFCIEPDQDMVSSPTIGYTVATLSSAASSPLGSQKADQVRELWGRFHGSIGNDATKGAAFQMAIWELVCDGDRNLSTGTMKMEGATAGDVAVKAQAQCWLNQITGCGPKANLGAFTSVTDQDQVFEYSGVPTSCTPRKCDPTPTPCTLSLKSFSSCFDFVGCHFSHC